MVNFCESCGTQQKEGNSFCVMCGARLEVKAKSESKTPDFTGTPISKKPKRQLWIVAAVLEFLCVLMFFLPTVRVTVSIPAEYAEKFSSLSNLVSDESKAEENENSFGDEGAFKGQPADNVDILEGDFKLMNVIDFFGTEAYQTICLFGVVVSFAFFVAPLINKEEVKVRTALFALLTQSSFFIVNIITLLVLKGKPVSLIRKVADMVVIADIPDLVVDLLCDAVDGFYRYKFNIWGWLYIGFSLLCLGLLVKIVFDNRKDLRKNNGA